MRQRPLPVRDVVDIGVQGAHALAAAHARGLVHRDIKPDNIMVRSDGLVKVLDFGLAKPAAATPSTDRSDVNSHTQTGMVFGTPRYMSPEQARGLDLDARSDVWSFGVVLYEMAAGRLPFTGMGTAFDRDLPPELLAIVSKALQTVRELRYASGLELCSDLRNLQHETLSRPAIRGLRPLMVASVVGIAAVGLLTLTLMRSNRATVPSGVQKTVAVLPFDNVSGDGDIEYLRLALADEVTTALSRTPSLAVRPMAAARTVDRGEMNAQQAGQRLRVGEVVAGHFSMQQSGSTSRWKRWRSTAIACCGATQSRLPRMIIALRDQLTSRIRNGLLPALGTQASAAATISATPTRRISGPANSSDPVPNRDAITMLERARLIEPGYADSWVALADRYYTTDTTVAVDAALAPIGRRRDRRSRSIPTAWPPSACATASRGRSAPGRLRQRAATRDATSGEWKPALP